MGRTVYYRRLYRSIYGGLWQSAAGDCSNLPFQARSADEQAGNDLIFPLPAGRSSRRLVTVVILTLFPDILQASSIFFVSRIHRCRRKMLSFTFFVAEFMHLAHQPVKGNHGHRIPPISVPSSHRQACFQDIFCLHVEVIGRLIEDQQDWPVQEVTLSLPSTVRSPSKVP